MSVHRLTLNPTLGLEGLLMQVDQAMSERREHDQAWMVLTRILTADQRAAVLRYTELVRRHEHARGARDVLHLIRDERLVLPRPAPVVVHRSRVGSSPAPKDAPPPPAPAVVHDAPFAVECAARSIEDLVQRRTRVTLEEVAGHLGLEPETQRLAVRHLRLNNRVVVDGRTLHRRTP